MSLLCLTLGQKPIIFGLIRDPMVFYPWVLGKINSVLSLYTILIFDVLAGEDESPCQTLLDSECKAVAIAWKQHVPMQTRYISN